MMHFRPWRIVRPKPSPRQLITGVATLYQGDNREVLRKMASNSIDAIVTDPPYALISTLKRFANSPRTEASMPTAGPYERASRGFMGERWDTGDTAHSVEFWRECRRVLKPGGYLLAMAGTRTYHRLACAIEDAGFEVRDMIQWLYGSGFPKSHNDGEGWGTALKPACEPVCMARKPLSEETIADNVRRFGTGTINIEGCRVGTDDTTRVKSGGAKDFPHEDDNWTPKPITVGSPSGRWPANVITDGSDEVASLFPLVGASNGHAIHRSPKPDRDDGYGLDTLHPSIGQSYRDADRSAARFFYCAKANAKDRAGSSHPTVKPVSLMRYLCRLVTPPGGVVLDPFAGTGTTGEACHLEGFRVIMIEREARFAEDIRNRMAALNVELAE